MIEVPLRCWVADGLAGTAAEGGEEDMVAVVERDRGLNMSTMEGRRRLGGEGGPLASVIFTRLEVVFDCLKQDLLQRMAVQLDLCT